MIIQTLDSVIYPLENGKAFLGEELCIHDNNRQFYIMHFQLK
jgi:hypothetical protein